MAPKSKAYRGSLTSPAGALYSAAPVIGESAVIVEVDRPSGGRSGAIVVSLALVLLAVPIGVAAGIY